MSRHLYMMYGEEDNDYYDDITQQTTVMTGDDTRGSIVQWTTQRTLYTHGSCTTRP